MIQITPLLLLHTGAGLNLISISIIPPSNQSRIKPFTALLLRTVSKKPLPLVEIVLPHVHIEKEGESTWFGILNGRDANLHVRGCAKIRYVHGIFRCIQTITRRNSRRVNIIAMGRDSEKSSIEIVTNGVCTVTASPIKIRIRADGDTTKIGTVLCCCLCIGRLTNYPDLAPNRKKRKVHR